MPSLETLFLDGASVRALDAAVLSEDVRDNCLPRLRAHFADLRATTTAGDDGGHAVTDVKFMMLGNGNAGKTQIIRRLMGEAFDPAVPSTHGIQIKAARLATDAGELPIVLRIWDFGGQDIYHGTHALFLKSRAVFPIVWSADTADRQEHERHGTRWRNYPLDYWVAYVKHLSGRHSPVLLVQAKVDTPADRRPAPIAEDWSKGLDWHDAVNSSAAMPRGINVLREKIIEAVMWLRDTQG
jgi:internalin A